MTNGTEVLTRPIAASPAKIPTPPRARNDVEVTRPQVVVKTMTDIAKVLTRPVLGPPAFLTHSPLVPPPHRRACRVSPVLPQEPRTRG